MILARSADGAVAPAPPAPRALRTLRLHDVGTLAAGEHAGGTDLPRHTHDDPSLCFVLHGRFAEYAPGHTADCVTGTLKLTPAGEPHWNRFPWGDTRGLRLEVHRERFAEVPSIARLLGERLLLTDAAPAAIARRLAGALASTDDAAAVVAEGLVLELLAALARQPAPRAPGRARWLARAEELIRAGYADPLSLAQVARAVDVHPVALARAWRRVHGCSVGEAIRRLRVERAARELVETDAALPAIAVRAGFFDQSHFTRLFRRHLGVTPAQWRRAHREG